MMNMNKALQLYNQVMKEDQNGQTVYEYLEYLGPMPHEAILMGKCDDGFPLLMNCGGNSVPPVVYWDDSEIPLKVVANHIAVRENDKFRVEYVVLTNRSEQWNMIPRNCVGVFPFWSEEADQVILSLANWAHGGTHKYSAMFLLIDGLQHVEDLNFDARQNLRWLILRGASRHVFIVSTGIETDGLRPWMENFKQITRDEHSYLYNEGNSVIRLYMPAVEI